MKLADYAGFVRLSWQGELTDLTQAARQLCAEAGELLSKLNKLDYKPNSKVRTLDLILECGDLLYYAVLTSMMTGTQPLLQIAIEEKLEPVGCEDPHTRTETMHRVIDKANAIMHMSLQFDPNTETIGVYLAEIVQRLANVMVDFDYTIPEILKLNMKKLESSDFNGWKV